MDMIPNPLIVPVGVAVGVLIAAPVGPVNIICIQRAISRGVIGGIAAGLGAVLGDGLIALMAALGVGVISGTIAKYHDIIQLVGGFVVMAFGLKLFFAGPVIDPDVTMTADGEPDWASVKDVLWDVPKTFLLTITNPGAVLGLVAIFGAVSTFVEVRGRVDAFTMVAAIMAGSLGWWVFLSSMIGRIRHKLDLKRVGQINKAAGFLMLGFGLLLVGELVVKALRGT
jgi:threonine/homoserine/homoserine lactone efflux protein